MLQQQRWRIKHLKIITWSHFTMIWGILGCLHRHQPCTYDWKYQARFSSIVEPKWKNSKVFGWRVWVWKCLKSDLALYFKCPCWYGWMFFIRPHFFRAVLVLPQTIGLNFLTYKRRMVLMFLCVLYVTCENVSIRIDTPTRKSVVNRNTTLLCQTYFKNIRFHATHKVL